MYYRLKYRSGTEKGRKGDSVLCGGRVLCIGQTVSCDVLLPASEGYEPQVFAYIVPVDDADGQGWNLVSHTDAYRIEVNGKPVAVAQRLQSGDRIGFADGRQRAEGNARTRGCIRISANINAGNSGGPVLARVDGTVKVIGIVSKVDTRASQGVFWAVPVTEVEDLRQLGGEAEETTFIRR